MASFKNLISNTSAQISSGGTITGDLVINGDLQVDGGGSLSFDEIIEGTQVIDVTNTEALLVRKNGDGGDVFTVDTTNSKVVVGDISLSGSTISDSSALTISSGDDIVIDAESDVNIDANGGDIRFKDNGTNFVTFSSTGSTGTEFVNGSSAFFITPDGNNCVLKLKKSASNRGARFTYMEGTSEKWHQGLTDSDHFSSGGDEYFISEDFTTPRFIIEPGGNIGMGGLPDENLHVISTGRTSLKLQGVATSDGVISDVQFFNSTDSVAAINVYRVSNNDQADMAFFTQPNGGSVTERMRIDSNGNVGIGIATPYSILHIDSGGDPTSVPTSGQNNIGIGETGTSNGYVSIGLGVAGATTTYRPALITYKNTQNGGNQAGELGFWTRNTTTASDAPTQRMVITDGGDIGIGEDSPAKPLHIKSSDNQPLRVESTDAYSGIEIKDSGSSTLPPLISALSDDFIFYGGHGSSRPTILTLTSSNQSATFAGTLTVNGDLLDVTGAHPTLKLTDSDDSNYGYVGYSDGALQFESNGGSESGAADIISFMTDGGNVRFKLDSNSRISLSNNDDGVSNTIFGKNAGDSDGAGDYNVFVGELAGGTGTQTDDADYNIGIGYSALTDLTNGESNIAIGGHCLENNTSGGANVAIGSWDSSTYQAPLTTNTVGSFNIAIGSGTLRLANDDSNDGSIGIGYGALNNQVGSSSNARFANATVAVGHKSLEAMTTGTKNIAIGFEAMNDMQTGTNNIALGYQAMDVLQGGDSSGGVAASANGGNHNIAIGTDAMGAVEGYRSNTEIDGNIAIGTNALLGGDLGNNNNYDFIGNIAIGYNAVDATGDAQPMTGTIGIGYQALTALTTGTSNTAIGYLSMGTNTNSSNNTAFGYYTLGNMDGGNGANTAVGNLAMLSNTTGATNTAVGDNASRLNQTGVDNVAVGRMALYSNTTDRNTAVGLEAGYTTTGADNTYVGYRSGKGASGAEANNVGVGSNSLLAVTTGGSNVAIGKDAMASATANHENVAIGVEALGDIAVGEGANIAIGYYAMRNVDEGTGGGDANYNIAIGYDALKGGDFGSSDLQLQGNVAIGMEAMNSTGANAQTGTVAIGHQSLKDLTSGARNTAVGYQSMDDLTVGEDNVALGYGALGGASTSSENKRNIAIGSSAMSGTNAGAGQNVAIGYGSLDGALTATADNNIAVGYEALGAVTTGRGNVAIGSGAGDAITAGVENVIVGRDSDISAVDSGNEIVLGYNVTGQGANKATIGNADITDVYMAQDSGATVHCGAVTVTSGNISLNKSSANQYILKNTGGDLRLKHEGTAAGDDIMIEVNDGGSQHTFAKGGHFQINGAGIQDTGNPGWTFVAGNANQGSVLEHACGDAGEDIAIFRTTGGIAGKITTSGTSTAFTTSSDYRLKENEVAMPDALTRLGKLKPYRFNWKSDKDTTVDGFFAHEVAEVVPEAIVGLKDAVDDKGDINPQGIDQSKLVPLLVKAVQELTAKVEALESKG